MGRVRGARITVRCDCGEVNYLDYGERWRCPKCGRTWDTGQISSEEYWGIMREMRRYRLQVMGVAVAVAAVGIGLGLLVGARFFTVMVAVLAFWFLFYMPRWRQKVRRRVRSLPTWNLRPE